jgi:peptidyl-prolyl cis-trans isomerase SurA
VNRTVVALLLALASPAAAQTLDRVAAVVGDQVILESEVAAQVQFLAMNNRIDPRDPATRARVLQSMVDDKLIVAQAIEDSVTVSEDEVTQAIDRAIQQRVQQAGSEARLEEAYGMSIARIKREYRDQFRQSLLSERLAQQRLGMTAITRREVEEFYALYKDSLGRVPEEIELAHIYREPTASPEQKAAARQLLTSLLDSIRAGVPFEDLAVRWSEDPGSAPRGGDLGLVRRGLFVKEFEAAVFALNEKELSPVVETKFGLHIIQLMERRGDAVRARHILRRVQRSASEADSTIAFLRRLRERALAGEDWADLAKQYSEDKQTSTIGGTLGTTDLEQLDKPLAATVEQLKQGEIAEPAPVRDGYHIVLVKRRIPSHPVSLEQDFQRLETLALNYKKGQEYNRWLEELRRSIYWQIR